MERMKPEHTKHIQNTYYSLGSGLQESKTMLQQPNIISCLTKDRKNQPQVVWVAAWECGDLRYPASCEKCCCLVETGLCWPLMDGPGELDCLSNSSRSFPALLLRFTISPHQKYCSTHYVNSDGLHNSFPTYLPADQQLRHA